MRYHSLTVSLKGKLERWRVLVSGRVARRMGTPEAGSDKIASYEFVGRTFIERNLSYSCSQAATDIALLIRSKYLYQENLPYAGDSSSCFFYQAHVACMRFLLG